MSTYVYGPHTECVIVVLRHVKCPATLLQEEVVFR